MSKHFSTSIVPAALAMAILMSNSAGAAPTDVVGIGIAGSNDHVYYFYSGGKVSVGTTSSPQKYKRTFNMNYPPRKQVITVGIAGTAQGKKCQSDGCKKRLSDWVYYWYKDGTVSIGTTNNALAYGHMYRANRRNYSSAHLPSGKTLIAAGIAGTNDHVYYWWSDGTVSSGTTSNPLRYRNYYRSNQPRNKTLIGVGIGGNDHVYYFYTDGTVSSGSTDNPTKYRPYYKSGL